MSRTLKSLPEAKLDVDSGSDELDQARTSDVDRRDTLVESIIKRADTLPYTAADADASHESASLYDLVEGVADFEDDEPPSEIRLRATRPPADCFEWMNAELEPSVDDTRGAPESAPPEFRDGKSRRLRDDP